MVLPVLCVRVVSCVCGMVCCRLVLSGLLWWGMDALGGVGVAVFFLWFVVVGCLGSFSGLGWFRVLRLVRAILVRLF